MRIPLAVALCACAGQLDGVNGGDEDGPGGNGADGGGSGADGGGGLVGEIPCVPGGDVRAFPCAEGWGGTTAGGRGGQVIKVTNLDAAGPGSLQEAVSIPGPRIVVFAVSGVIEGDVEITEGELTIAGQTAPGAGITVRGQLRTLYDPPSPINDIIVRHVRVRPPPLIGESSDALQFSQNQRVILDHVTVSWGSDETIDIYEANGITIQWSTIEESDTEGHPEGMHNYGLINGPDGNHVTIHHTLFAHHMHRLPALANGPSSVVNNVMYDFHKAFHHDNTPNSGGFNVVANYFKVGPSGVDPLCFHLEAPGRYFFQDNYVDDPGGSGIFQDPCDATIAPCLANSDCAAGEIVTTAFGEPPDIATQSAEAAYLSVLRYAGAFPRDAVSRRTIEDVMQGDGAWGRIEPSDLMEGMSATDPPADQDDDGMADAWESANGLDPADGSDASSVTASGYTAIEEYVNELADQLIEAP